MYQRKNQFLILIILIGLGFQIFAQDIHNSVSQDNPISAIPFESMAYATQQAFDKSIGSQYFQQPDKSTLNDLRMNTAGIVTSTGSGNPKSSTNITATNYTLLFDGTDDYVALPAELYSNNLSGGTAITIEYWFKGSEIQSAVRFQEGNQYVVAGWSSEPKFIVSTDGLLDGVAIIGTEDGEWHHVACVWQQNTVNGFKTYVDGIISAQKNAGNVTLPTISSGAWLGSFLTQEFLNGQLDEVRIWNIARSQAEIQATMNTGLAGNETGLVAYYKMSNGAGTVLTDDKTSGTKYDGTLVNGTNWVAISEPTIQAHSIEFSSIASASLFASWSNGNGDGRIVFAKQANTGTAVPVDNVSYTASTVFGEGTEIGSTGWYCVYNGTGSSVTVTGLSSSTDYIFQAFEYNQSAGTSIYLTSTASNNPQSITTPAVTNYSISFDGDGDDVVLPNTLYSSNFNGGTAITIEYWFKGSRLLSPVRFQQANDGWIVAGWNPNPYPKFIVSTDGNLEDGVAIIGAVDGDWHHVACVWQQNTVNGFKTYVDGVISAQKDAGNVTLPIINSGAWLGSYDNNEFLNGQLDEVRIWNVARTQQQLQENMFCSLNGNETGLVAYYKMSNGEGTTLSDNKTSGTKYDGMLRNASWSVSDIPTALSWEGSSNTSWSTTNNWNYGFLPGLKTDVIITTGGSAPVIEPGTGASCHNLTINSGASLTINPGGSLITSGAITNNGTTTANLSIAGNSNDWHLLSSPMVAQEISGNFIDPNGYDFYLYNEASDQWVNRKNLSDGGGEAPFFDVINGNLLFKPAKGYLVAYADPNTNPKAFVGTPNSGLQSIALSKTDGASFSGANLLGNPYPSSIDWKAASGWNRDLLVDDDEGPASGYTMYIWNQNVNNYGTFISNGSAGTNGATQYIAPMQGFFVMAASAGTLQMTDEVRVHNGADGWLKQQQQATPVLKMQVTHPILGSDEAILEFSDQYSGGAPKWPSMVAEAPSVWIHEGTKDFAICFTSPNRTESLALHFQAGIAGSYVFSIDLAGLTFHQLILEDLLLGTTHDLLSNNQYNFAADPNESSHRFNIRLGVVGIDETPETNRLSIWQQGDILQLTGIEAFTDLQLFDINGRLLAHHKLQTANSQQIKAPQQPGIYMVKLLSTTQIHTQKVIIY